MANVGYATLQIIPSARGFGTSLNGQVAPGLAAAGATGGKKFGAGFLGSVKSIAGPLAAVAGVAAVGNFFKGAVSGASDLNETISKSNVIFGDASKAVEAFARDSSRNILLTTQQAIDASASFGVFGKSAGLTGKSLSGFSTDLTALASDLSSFYNTSTDEAVTALGAALRGESEPIRRYGVLLDDASLRAEALRQGLIKSTKTALTPQNKVLAAQALIMKQTKDAQGDAARTSGNLANQQRILAKNFAEIQVEVGTALLPVITKFVQLLNNGIRPAFDAIKTAGAPIIAFFKGLGGETGKANGAANSFRTTMASLRDFLIPIGAQLATIGGQIGAVVGPAFKSISDIITGTVLPAIRAFLPAVRPVLQFFLNAWGVVLINVLKAAIGIIKGVFKVFAGLLNVFAGLFTGDWSRLWKGVKEIFSGVWTAVIAVAKGAIGLLVNLFKQLGSLLVNVIQAGFSLLYTAVKAGIVNTVRFFIDLPGKIINALVSLPVKLFNFGKNMVQGFINGIKSMAGSIVSAIASSITDKIPDFVKDKLGIASPSKVFIEIGKNVGLGFIKGVQGTTDKIRDTFSKLAEDIKKTGSKKLIDAVKDTQKKILDLATKRDNLRDRYKEATSSLKDLKDEAKDYIKSVSSAVVATAKVTDRSTFAGIVSDLTNAVTQASAFAKVITELRRAGLNNTALQQLIDAGPGEALDSAKAILGSGDLGIKTLNELQSQLKAQGDAIGGTISGAIYDAAIEDAEKAVKSIGKELTQVENQIVKVAAAFAKEIAKIGGIKAPAWLKDLIDVTRNTVPSNKAQSAPKSPNLNSRTAGTFAGTSGRGSNVVVNNYNPVAEKTSVTVSNVMTRLALLEA